MSQYSLSLNKSKNDFTVIVKVVPQSHTERGYAKLIVLNQYDQEEMIHDLMLKENINKSNYKISKKGSKLANDNPPYVTEWVYTKKRLDKVSTNKVKSIKKVTKEVKNINLDSFNGE
jgi:hypothetical protein